MNIEKVTIKRPGTETFLFRAGSSAYNPDQSAILYFIITNHLLNLRYFLMQMFQTLVTI